MFKIEFYDNHLHTSFSIYAETEKKLKEEILDLSEDLMWSRGLNDEKIQVPRYSNINVWKKVDVPK